MISWKPLDWLNLYDVEVPGNGAGFPGSSCSHSEIKIPIGCAKFIGLLLGTNPTWTVSKYFVLHGCLYAHNCVRSNVRKCPLLALRKFGKCIVLVVVKNTGIISARHVFWLSPNPLLCIRPRNSAIRLLEWSLGMERVCMLESIPAVQHCERGNQ